MKKHEEKRRTIAVPNEFLALKTRGRSVDSEKMGIIYHLGVEYDDRSEHQMKNDRDVLADRGFGRTEEAPRGSGVAKFAGSTSKSGNRGEAVRGDRRKNLEAVIKQ